MELEIAPLRAHQRDTLSKLRQTPVLYDMSDPGTGKTRPALEAFWERRQNGGGKGLVLAPKSILQPAWGNEVDKWCPGMRYSVAYARNRKAALERDVDLYITNHDAVKWIDKNMPKGWLDDFDTLIVDESTAFKNKDSQRSKALLRLSRRFEYRECMSGTPNPNTVLELWHPVLVLDQGARLGDSFYRFRHAVSEPEQVGPDPRMQKWHDKPGAEEAVFDSISDICIRHRFEDCVDIPEHTERDMLIELPPKLRRQYDQMFRQAVMMIESGEIVEAVNAAVVNNKLLQIASGAIYDQTGGYHVLDDYRSELVADLVEARDACVVAFLWKHQRDGIARILEARKISYAVIDGSVTNDHVRTSHVEHFQNGDLRCLLVHPQSAGHGLTLTRGNTTILTSPTYNSEHYKQLLHRIYRTGQKRKTETIRIVAQDTIDQVALSSLTRKLTAMDLLLELMEYA